MTRIGSLVRFCLLIMAVAPYLGCASADSFLSNPLAKGSSESSSIDELKPQEAIKACLAVAQKMEKSGNETGAVQQYERVCLLDPNNYQATRRLAVLYDRQYDFSKADEQYRKLVKSRPKDAELLNDWGYSYYERTMWKEAAQTLQQAVEIDPNNRRARSNLGLALGQQKRYDEALEQFKKVVSEAEAHSNLAFVYWSQGNFDKARQECCTARQLDPSCSRAQDILAQLDRPELSPEEKQARVDALTKPKTPDRERNRAMAAAAAAAATGTSSTALTSPLTVGPATPTNSGAPDAQPVYRSPSGTAWIPTKPAAATPGAVTTTGSITQD